MRRATRRVAFRVQVVAGLVVAGLVVAACGAGGADPGPSASSGPIVVTFQVAESETFRVLLTDAADIATATRLAAGDGDAPSIPNGRVIRGETGVNEGYSWSLDPDDFEFADATIEVCDGLPSDVEQGLVTSDRYCPWSAVVSDVQPAP